jgi:acyl carrier protein
VRSAFHNSADAQAFLGKGIRRMDEKIKQVFNSVFQVSPEQVSDTLSPQDVSGWDSLGHVRLVTALQEQFGVEFDVDEIMSMENVAEIKKIIAARA